MQFLWMEAVPLGRLSGIQGGGLILLQEEL